jgi:hypothetical protein
VLPVTLVPGMPWAPGLDWAYERGDVTIAASMVAMAASWSVVSILMLEQTRRVVRDNEGSPLALLGVGTVQVSKRRFDSVISYYHQNYSDYRSADPSREGPTLGFKDTFFWVPLWGVLVYLGVGCNDPWENRLGLVVFYYGWLYQDYSLIRLPWLITLKTACHLVEAQIAQISATIHTELCSEEQDTSDNEWAHSVAAPCRRLVDTLEVLTAGWGSGMVILMGNALLNIVIVIGFLLSPFLDELDELSGVTWVATLIRLGLLLSLPGVLLGPLKLASGTALVSSNCDILMENLNRVRLNDLNLQQHQRVSVLETALKNVNNGQGIGFKVLGLVVNKQKLRQMTASVYAAASVVTPFLLQIYADKRPKTDIGSTDTCKLSAMQQAQVDGFAQALAVNTTCTLNITFGT